MALASMGALLNLDYYIIVAIIIIKWLINMVSKTIEKLLANCNRLISLTEDH